MIRKAAGFCILLLVTLNLQGAWQQDSVLNRLVTVYADQLPVATILRNISDEQRIYFSYDASLVNTDRKISLHLENRPLQEILHQIFPFGEFRFLRKEDYIIISAYGEDEPFLYGTTPLDTITVLTLEGRVADYITGEPLVYVSIALQNEPIGTITNQDGNYVLKLPVRHMNDSLVFSFIGYATGTRAISDLQRSGSVRLHSTSIRIKEVRVKAVSVEELLDGVRDQIAMNYPSSFRQLTGFYRETIRQDADYISISEAVLEILKSPYTADFREDKVRLRKARKSPDIKPFHWVNFKLQGGPFTITKLDAIKTHETFIDREFQHLYRYAISDVIWFRERPVYVVTFRPVKSISFPLFKGEMYIDRESLALIHARFSLDNYGLDLAEESLIKRKPRGFKVKPLHVDYEVDYQFHDRKWHLHSARALVSFRVRSREDRVNSVFESSSELLVTDIKNTDLKRFPGKELFTINDIFTDISVDYDEGFWGNYNIIKPDENLQNAIRILIPQSLNQ